jgi:hypothetical protein
MASFGNVVMGGWPLVISKLWVLLFFYRFLLVFLFFFIDCTQSFREHLRGIDKQQESVLRND